AQFDSEAVYGSVKKALEEQGVIFTDMDTAVREHGDIIKRFFGSVVPMTDNKFAALNTAVWSGGSFVYVPKGVKVKLPLQAYFRINAADFGQFERTLIIAEEGSDLTYLEGCTAPIYIKSSLHAAVVEIVAKDGAHVKYVTVQNWSKNVYNLVTQRAHAEKDAKIEWIDVNLGGKGNMKYPCILLKGENAEAEIMSVAIASSGQVQDTGGKLYHLAPNTRSRFVSKSVSSGNGNAIARFLVHIDKNAKNATVYTKCDAMLMDEESKASTYPYLENNSEDASLAHEASIGKISKEAVEYLMSRGISEDDAKAMIVFGFISNIVQGLPMDYLLELKRLIELDIEKEKKII
ncbi:MAG: Fe-S cluster assembly protein SufB, partial [Candidatus Micrarchaeales archaeon]